MSTSVSMHGDESRNDTQTHIITCTTRNVHNTLSGVAPGEDKFRAIDLGEVALRSSSHLDTNAYGIYKKKAGCPYSERQARCGAWRHRASLVNIFFILFDPTSQTLRHWRGRRPTPTPLPRPHTPAADHAGQPTAPAAPPAAPQLAPAVVRSGASESQGLCEPPPPHTRCGRH